MRTQKANEELVASSTWPFLQAVSSTANMAGAGDSPLTYSVWNSGVGPAKAETFELFYKGKPISSARALLAACCSSTLDKEAELHTSTVAPTVFKPGEERPFLILQDNSGDRALRAALSGALNDISFRACYCSILNECWLSDLQSLRPKTVRTCPSAAVPFRG